MTKTPFVKPYLKWAGGKRQILPELKKYIPPQISGTYYEPFVGAGALFFDLQRKKAVINDANEELINTYLTIRDQCDELIDLLKKYEDRNNREDFYVIRRLDREENYSSLGAVDKAARFIYLNKTCYNGLYRVNSSGLFNTPFGNYKNPNICDDNVIRAVSKYLNGPNINIRQGDFDDALWDVKKNDFIYFDPPYHSEDNTNFTGYNAGGFSEDEQYALFLTFKRLSDSGAKCMLSNSSTKFINDLYKDYKIMKIKVGRSINSDANGRGAVEEVIVLSWDFDGEI